MLISRADELIKPPFKCPLQMHEKSYGIMKNDMT